IRQHQEIHVVMGNEACDLDSTISALALAYFLTQTSPGAKPAVVPVLNIPRADFALRTETTFLLRDRGIPAASLIFRDEIDLGGLHQAGLLSLTLVDHHVLPGADAALEEAVVEVLDHRPLERERGARCQVTVEPVGSCATLVTERILQGPPGVLDGTTAALLHGQSWLGRGHGGRECHTGDITVTLRPLPSAQTFLLRPGLLQDLEAFCQHRGYAGLVAMTVSFNERHEPTRKLAVYSPQEPLRSTLCRALEEATTPSLLLRPLPSPWPCVVAYAQGNATAARKKVLPILRAAL
ncbi:PRUN1 Exopolyphosphatase, partial [Chloropsis cyanopogon]|nr:PRUN1 Exopolyphosphatase [Chloropsis cyanopogon]